MIQLDVNCGLDWTTFICPSLLCAYHLLNFMPYPVQSYNVYIV